MKILLASIFHETNTFSPIPCSVADFTMGSTLDGSGSVDTQNGERVLAAMRGTNTALAAFIDACEGRGPRSCCPSMAPQSPLAAAMRRPFGQCATASWRISTTASMR